MLTASIVGDEGDDAHRRVTKRTDQWEDFIDAPRRKYPWGARQQHGPQIAGGGAVRRIVGRAGGRRRHGHWRPRGERSAQGGVPRRARQSSGAGGRAAVSPGRRFCRSVRAGSAPRRGVRRGAVWRCRRPDLQRRVGADVPGRTAGGRSNAAAAPTRAIGAFAAHRGVERAAAAVCPAAHLVTSILLEQAAADAGAQHPAPHLGLHRGHSGRSQPGGFVKHHLCRRVRGVRSLEYAIDDAEVKMQVRVRRRAVAVAVGRRQSQLSKVGDRLQSRAAAVTFPGPGLAESRPMADRRPDCGCDCVVGTGASGVGAAEPAHARP